MKVVVAENAGTRNKGGAAGKAGKRAVLGAMAAVALLAMSGLPKQAWAASAVCVQYVEGDNNSGTILTNPVGNPSGTNAVACGRGNGLGEKRHCHRCRCTI